MKPRKIAVIGIGKFGSKLVEILIEKGATVLAIDHRAESIEAVKDIATEVVQVDAYNKKVFEMSGVHDVDLAVVSFGGANPEINILVTAMLKEVGVKEIIARSISKTHTQILTSLGVNRIILPEEDTAINLAHTIIYPGILGHLHIDGPWDISEVQIGEGSQFDGKTIRDIEARSRYHVVTLILKREKKSLENGVEEDPEIKELPRDDYILKGGDVLIIFGEAEKLEAFEMACASE